MVQNDETQYIARILDGDTECFSAFLDRYSRPLYVLIVQIVGCSEDAEELVQDVFLKAFRCLGSYRGSAVSLPGFIGLLIPLPYLPHARKSRSSFI